MGSDKSGEFRAYYERMYGKRQRRDTFHRRGRENAEGLSGGRGLRPPYCLFLRVLVVESFTPLNTPASPLTETRILW